MYQQRRLCIASLFLCGGSAFACSDWAERATVTEPQRAGHTEAHVQRAAILPGRSKEDPRRPETLDEYFARVADSIPGFAGAYVDAATGPIINLVDTSRAPEAVAALARTIERAMGSDPRPITAIRVRQVHLDYRTLKESRDRVNQLLLLLDGVISTDIDEVRNRVVVGVQNGQALAMVRQMVVREGLVGVEAGLEDSPDVYDGSTNSEAAADCSTLLTYCSPTPGGFMIGNGIGDNCTLGFNAYLGSNQAGIYDSDHYFVTNAHCTNSLGGTEGTIFYQPDRNALGLSQTLGTEFREPLWGGQDTYSGCPGGAKCSLADATLVRYSYRPFSWEFGRIARTTFRGSGGAWGSTTVDPGRPRFPILDSTETILSGVYYQKVGMKTGWTQGLIWDSCKDYTMIHKGVRTNFVLLCQYSFDYPSDHGDSGSPVFQMNSLGQARLAGMVWGVGSKTWFSQYAYISWELLDRDRFDVRACPSGSFGCWPRLYVSNP